jgi:cholesterol transport system auxiliary component
VKGAWCGACLSAAALSASGCALLSNSSAPHYFEPDPPRIAAASPASPACSLELGDISAGDDLGQSIAFRRTPREVGYYEKRRWSEAPDNYLRRALITALFDSHRCQRSVSGDEPILDARLLAFEEDVGPPRRAHVAVHVILYDDRAVQREATLEAVQPVAAAHGDSIDPFVRAVSQALDEVVGQVVDLAVAAASDEGR